MSWEWSWNSPGFFKISILHAVSAFMFSSYLFTSDLSSKNYLQFFIVHREKSILFSRHPQFATTPSEFDHITLTPYFSAIVINAQILHRCLHNALWHFLSLECLLPLCTEKLILSLLFMTQRKLSSIYPMSSLLIKTI